MVASFLAFVTSYDFLSRNNEYFKLRIEGVSHLQQCLKLPVRNPLTLKTRDR